MYISAKEISSYPFYSRWFFRNQEKKMGKVLLPGLLWGRIPFLHTLFVLFWRYLDRKRSSLDPALRALIQVRVAQVNWCAFCIDYNSLNLIQRTGSMDKVDALDNWHSNPIFSTMEKDALEYAEKISQSQVKISEDLMSRLKHHFSDDQIVELTALISFQNMSAKFNAALDIPAQGLCKL